MRIYIGHLPPSVTEKDIQQAFTPFGDVQAVNIVKAKSSGDSLGYGFVIMPLVEQAQKAIAAMNNREFHGRPIRVEKGKHRLIKPGPPHKRRK